MPSQTQIDVNRLNSQKSTGPTSQEGKAASSLNALKSGIHANSHISHGEDPAALDALTAAFLLQFQPAGPTSLRSSIPLSPPSGPNAASVASRPNSGTPATNRSTPPMPNYRILLQIQHHHSRPSAAPARMPFSR